MSFTSYAHAITHVRLTVVDFLEHEVFAAVYANTESYSYDHLKIHSGSMYMPSDWSANPFPCNDAALDWNGSTGIAGKAGQANIETHLNYPHVFTPACAIPVLFTGG